MESAGRVLTAGFGIRRSATRLAPHRGVGPVLGVVRDFGSVGVSQYLLVEGVEADVVMLACLSTPETQAAQDALKCAPHVLVTVRVDDWVHQRV